MTAFTVMVRGTPKPQGSAKAFVYRDKASGEPRASVTSDTKDLKPWRNAIAGEVRRVMGTRPVPQGPMVVHAIFTMQRPKSHWTSSGLLKPAAPLFPTTRPDVDKLARAVLDAMTAVCFADDSQVVELVARKEYQSAPTDPTGVTVHVSTLDDMRRESIKELYARMEKAWTTTSDTDCASSGTRSS